VLIIPEVEDKVVVSSWPEHCSVVTVDVWPVRVGGARALSDGVRWVDSRAKEGRGERAKAWLRARVLFEWHRSIQIKMKRGGNVN
jgi:hypothetical protein